MAIRRGAATPAVRALLRGCTSGSLSTPTESSPFTTPARSVLAGQRSIVLEEEQHPCDSYSTTSVRRTLHHQPAVSAFTAFRRSRLLSSSSAGATSRVVIVEDDAQYESIMNDVQNKETLAVVYYTAQWCGPCKQIAPYVDQLSQQFDDVTFLKVDVDKLLSFNKEHDLKRFMAIALRGVGLDVRSQPLEVEKTMKNSNIAVVPTFHFHKKGELVGEMTGAVKDKLEGLVKSLRSTS